MQTIFAAGVFFVLQIAAALVWGAVDGRRSGHTRRVLYVRWGVVAVAVAVFVMGYLASALDLDALEIGSNVLTQLGAQIVTIFVPAAGGVSGGVKAANRTAVS